MICMRNVVRLIVGLVMRPSFSYKILFSLRLSYGGLYLNIQGVSLSFS